MTCLYISTLYTSTTWLDLVSICLTVNVVLIFLCCKTHSNVTVYTSNDVKLSELQPPFLNRFTSLCHDFNCVVIISSSASQHAVKHTLMSHSLNLMSSDYVSCRRHFSTAIYHYVMTSTVRLILGSSASHYAVKQSLWWPFYWWNFVTTSFMSTSKSDIQGIPKPPGRLL